MVKKFVIICLVLLSVTSCSVKKRTYRNGYYIDWAYKGKNKKSDAIALNENRSALSDQPEKEEVKSIHASSAPSVDNDLTTSKKVYLSLKDTCGDKIFFKSGDIAIAKVIEVSDDKIKYKRCDNLDGPLFVVSKANVQSITYTNGVTDVIVPPAYNPNNSNLNEPKPAYQGAPVMHPKASWSLGLLITGVLTSFILIGFIGIILALILSNKAIKDIKAQPTRYKGYKLARIVSGISLGILSVFAFIIIIAIAASM